MDRIEISDDQVVPLDNIAPGVRGLRILFVNVFGVTHEDGSWTLVDAGVAKSASRIRTWVETSFGRPPVALVLTHGHPDHLGDAAELADGWDCPIFAHELEMPFLTGREAYPVPDWKAGGGIMPLVATLFPRGPFDLGNRLKLLPSDGKPVRELPGWTLLHTPGHTPGHVSFFRENDRTLIVGDAFCTTKAESFFDAAVAQPPEMHGPPAYLTSNWADARASVERLANLAPLTVAVGHGKPLGGEAVPERLQRLAEEFDRVAVPDDVKGE